MGQMFSMFLGTFGPRLNIEADLLHQFGNVWTSLNFCGRTPNLNRGYCASCLCGSDVHTALHVAGLLTLRKWSFCGSGAFYRMLQQNRFRRDKRSAFMGNAEEGKQTPA